MAIVPKSKKKRIRLPEEFVPRFWSGADSRVAIVKEIRRRYELLLEHTGADSYQKDLLVQRAIFLAVRLESMEVEAAETGRFEAGVYTQASNALLGLLKTLGLEKKAPKPDTTLQDIVGSRR